MTALLTMGASVPEEPTVRIRTVDYHEYKSSEADIVVEIPSSLPSSLEQDQEKLAQIDVYETPAPHGCILTTTSAESQQTYLVDWDDEHDAKHPRNWSIRRKWTVMAIASALQFMSPVASSIIAPSLQDIGRDLNIESESEKSLCLSILVLGFAFGPLVLAPLSELYGRSIVLQITNAFFILFNALCGFSRNKAQLIVCRLFAGIGGSAPLALGPAMIADLFIPEERGLAAGIYSFMPIMGPAIAPICGSFIAEYSTWRWGLWAVSLVNIPILLLAVLLLKETYAPVLLKQKRKQLAKQNPDARFYTLDDQTRQSFASEMTMALVRPVRMMFTQVIIIVMGVYQAYMYGLMYIILTTFSSLWEDQYHEPTSIGGLNYISLGLGYSLGILTSGYAQDRLYAALKRRNNGIGAPEFRIPMLLPVSGLLLPLGFLLYGWGAEYKLHWIVPNIGAFLFAAGIMMGFNALVTYVVDSYVTYAASASAATAVLRSVAAFLLPLGAGQMYERLGWGWGNTLLGALAFGVGLPAAVCVWVWGRRLRERSTFAQG